MARSDTLEDKSGKHARAHESPAPFGIVVRGRLGGDDFVEGLALLFEGRHLCPGMTIHMAFKLKDRVRRIGQHEVYTVEDIREPDEHILRLNPAAENIYWIQRGEDIASRALAREGDLELAE